MTQQPNIISSSNSILNNPPIPVSRSLGKSRNETIEVSELPFSIPSPDSGYALKLLKNFEHLWKNHHKNKLISKIISNLVIYQASKVGRAPTKRDFEFVISILKIKDKDLGLLTDEALVHSANENIKGLHLSQLIDTNLEDKI